MYLPKTARDHNPVLCLIMQWCRCFTCHLTDDHTASQVKGKDKRELLSEYFNGSLLLPLWFKIRKYTAYTSRCSPLGISRIINLSYHYIILICTLFFPGAQVVFWQKHTFIGVKPLKVLSLKVKKFKYFVIRSSRVVGRHHIVCKTYFQRYCWNKRAFVWNFWHLIWRLKCGPFNCKDVSWFHSLCRSCIDVGIKTWVQKSKVTYMGENIGSYSFQNTLFCKFAFGCLKLQKNVLCRFTAVLLTYSYIKVYSFKWLPP